MAEVGNSIARLNEVDKRHSIIEQLTPAIQIKLIGTPMVLPFNHIMNFTVNAGKGGMTASLQVFDPTFSTMDAFFYNAAMLTRRGVQMKIKWGWAYTPSVPAFVNDSTSRMMRDQFMSEEFGFFVLKVESEPMADGNMVNVSMVPHVFDPVMTTIAVNDVFITGAIGTGANKKKVDPALETMLKRQGESGKKQLKELKAGIELINSSLRGDITTEQNRIISKLGKRNIVFAGSGKKLTFDFLYFELIKIAERNNHLGINRQEKWQKPLPVLPQTLDLDHDYVYFDGKGQNIWTCLSRLAKMMVSKSNDNANYNASLPKSDGKKTKPPGERHRMVGGRFGAYTARLSRAKDLEVRLEAGRAASVEELPPSQTTYLLWQFDEAPYEYMIKPTKPIATYHFFGGSKEYNRDSLTEIIEFSTDLENSSKYLIDPSIMQISKIRNPVTGLSVEGKDLKVDGGGDGEAGTTSVKKAGSGATTSSQGTDPSTDTRNGNEASSSVSVSAMPSKKEVKKFDVPIVATTTGEASAELNLFLDRMRTKASANYFFGATITVIGDPRLDPTLINGQTTIHIVYRNRNGDIHPIFTGDYYIFDVKHTIESGAYKTTLELQKTAPYQEAETAEDDFTKGMQRLNQGAQIIDIALITVHVKESGDKWIPYKVVPYDDPDYPNKEIVTRMLRMKSGSNVKENKNPDVGEVVVEKIVNLIGEGDNRSFSQTANVLNRKSIRIDVKRYKNEPKQVYNKKYGTQRQKVKNIESDIASASLEGLTADQVNKLKSELAQEKKKLSKIPYYVTGSVRVEGNKGSTKFIIASVST